MTEKKGFTLVELLVVIAIIGLLSTLAVVALGSARAKARDARRISDIKQIQTALELYFADQGTYPQEASAIVLGGASAEVLSFGGGFSAAAGASGEEYMSSIPAQIKTPASIADYTYQSAAVDDYTIGFEIETVTGGLAAGAHTATPGGIQ